MVFSDKASFIVSGKVNKPNVRIWESQNPYEVVEKERNSPKLNVWYGLMHNQIIGSFIFAESTITVGITSHYRCDGVVVRASASQSVDQGFISQLESYQKTLKMVFTASLLGAQQNKDRVENKPASLLVVS